MAEAPANTSLLKTVRIADLTKHFKITPNQVRRLRKLDPSFPRPFKIGTGKNAGVFWLESEINAWMANRPRVMPDGLPQATSLRESAS